MKRHITRSISIALLALPLLAQAQVMSSDNYRIPNDDLSGGGIRSTSTNYIVEDTVSEFASPTGEGLSSTNYLACVGFQCLTTEAAITVTYAVQTGACTGTSSSSPPYSVALGALTTSSVSTASNRVCVRVTSNAGGGTVVQVKSANAALKSTATPGDTIPSNTATLAAGTAGYGVCSSQATSGFSAVTPFAGSCDTSSGNSVGGLSTSSQIVWSASGPVNNALGELLTKAAVSTATPAHDDYGDTLTITVTGTF